MTALPMLFCWSVLFSNLPGGVHCQPFLDCQLGIMLSSTGPSDGVSICIWQLAAAAGNA